MIKEAKNIDFYTTGRQPSEEEFIRISEWIKHDKRKSRTPKLTEQLAKRKLTLRNKKLSKRQSQVSTMNKS